MTFLRTAFLDTLMNLALLLCCLFALAFIHMRPPAQDKSIEQKAEIVVEMTWPDGSHDDIDLWLLLPDGRKVGFPAKDAGMATLDRDDRGIWGDTYFDGTERKLIASNKEVMAIRALAPGRYVVNVHFYADFSSDASGFPETFNSRPMPIRLKATRLNPRVAEVGAVDVELWAPGEQRTAFALDVAADGAVTMDKAADLPFVEVRK